ncbi:uncharacterized protein LOC131353883 [Hemibagrus wyckioides]|uniref:uncharacterized protein LOC131353883 n=1 Tax=Hemibagrus wyckioides TaxID=337641 RepID=UPI00266CE2B5|nr:uncharacterized protein LOC131353883 [Hemibagrus wyckioides]
MPCGLSNAPVVLQNFMNEIFRDMLHRFVIVLDCLRRHRLYLKLKKYEFHHPIIQFLGYVISTEGIQMDQSKVEAVRSWPQPHTIKDLQRFLGFANFYQCFITNFSEHTAPLTSLLCNKPRSLRWTTSAVEAFKKLKAAFCSAPILVHPDPS